MALVPIVQEIPVLDIVETVEELELEAENAVVLQHYLDVLPNSILVSNLAEQCLRAWLPRLFGKLLRKKPFSDIEFTMTAPIPYAAWRYVMNHTDGRDTHFKQTAALRRYQVELGTMWGLQAFLQFQKLNKRIGQSSARLVQEPSRTEMSWF